MVFYHCPHDEGFGNSRCQGEPDWKVNEDRQVPIGTGKEFMTVHIQEGCKLTPDKCGKLIRLEEAVDLTAPWLQDKEVIEEGKPKEKSKEKGKEETKSKTKAAKKLEGEIAQKSMF